MTDNLGIHDRGGIDQHGCGLSDFPSLTGIERARIEDFNWAVATFTWAVGELRRLENLAAKRPKDIRLQDATADTAGAILEQLENWEPSNGLH